VPPPPYLKLIRLVQMKCSWTKTCS